MFGDAIDLNTALMLAGSIFGTIVGIAVIIILFVHLRRRAENKRNAVTNQGTDKSTFAKNIMDEYHEERNQNNGL